MAEPDRPVVRLRPKVPAQSFRHGFPWVYDNELVTDRRTRSLAPGAIARLEDAGREAVCTVTVNPGSKLIARILDPDPAAIIDPDWLLGKLGKALKLRQGLYPEPYYRWVHAEGDGLPGLVIDRFGAAVVVQPNAAWIETMLPALADAILELAPETQVIVKNASGRARAQEGLDAETGFLKGEVSEPVPVPMNGATYMADLTGGQKTGLFFDQRENHAYFQRFVKGASVLDVFSHVGGFGLAALAAGATSAMAVDGSADALDLARQGAEGVGRGADFVSLKADAFKAMEDLAADGATFDAVVCDPPAFAPSKKALSNGLRAYERVARSGARLVSPDGLLVLCSCSHAADLSKFLPACARGIGRAGRRAQLVHTGFASADHPLLPQLGDTGYLKALFFRMVG